MKVDLKDVTVTCVIWTQSNKIISHFLVNVYAYVGRAQ